MNILKKKFLLFLLVSPVCYASGLQKTITRSFRGFNEMIADLYIHNQSEGSHSSPFNQALAELYAQNPHLLQEQLLQDEETEKESYIQSILKDKKNVIQKCANWGPFIFFLIQLYKKYNAVYVHDAHNQSLIQKLVSYTFPSLFINVPNHVSFFLGGTELLLQAYLIKLLLKMVIFCFL